MNVTETSGPQLKPGVEAALNKGGAKRRRPWGLYILGFFLVLLLSLGGAGYYLAKQTYKIQVGAGEVQTAVVKFFPKTKKFDMADKAGGILSLVSESLAAQMEVKEPEVTIPADGNYIECKVKLVVKAKLPNANFLKDMQSTKEKEYPGYAIIRSSVKYDSSQGAFFLKDPKVVKMDLPAVPKQIDGKIQELVSSTLVKEMFDKISVYELKESWKERAAKLLLKQVTVEQGKIVASVGL